MRMTDLEFIEGERRIIQFEVVSTKKNEKVIVTEAKWELRQDGELFDEGTCTVEQNQIEVLLDLQYNGIFELTVTYLVPPETRKVRCTVHVH